MRSSEHDRRETRLVNLLPHDLVVINGTSFVLATSGHVARMEQHVIDDMMLPVPGAMALS
jgi:hypothetical protein